MCQILEKLKKSEKEFTGSILHAGLSSDPLGELTALSKTPSPNFNFRGKTFSLQQLRLPATKKEDDDS